MRRLLLLVLLFALSARLAGGSAPDAATSSALIAAIHAGDLEEIRRLAAEGANLNASDPGNGLSAIHLAQIEGRTEARDLLIELGADGTRPMPAPAATLDRIGSQLAEADSPGLAILVARSGQIFFRKAWGLADMENKVPLQENSIFRIGSITKQFTATAILLLAKDGKLKLSDPLSTFYPGFPRGSDITLHHLLTHTSGLVSYTGLPGFMKTVTSEAGPDEIIAGFRDLPLEFTPGSKFAYCNSGYFLLGEIVSQVSGKPYPEFLQERIFRPLAMKHTGAHRPGLKLEREAKGYSYNRETGKAAPARNWHMSRAGGAGELYSTLDDLYRWNAAFFSDRVLTPEQRKLAHTPALTAGGYGYGWAIRRFRETVMISHAGGLDGFLSNLSHLPGEDFTVVILTNASPPHPGLEPDGLTRLIAQLYLWSEFPPCKPVIASASLDETSLDAYVGRYDYGGAILEVTRDGKRLMAQLTGQAAFEILPQGKDKFAWKAVDAQVQFHRDATGKIVGASHFQNGITIEAKRLPPRPAIAVKPEVLRRFVGRYDYGDGAVMTITLGKDGQLKAQLTGQPAFPIFPEAENRFFWRVVEAGIEFTSTDGGKTITGAIHRQGGHTITAPRLPD